MKLTKIFIPVATLATVAAPALSLTSCGPIGPTEVQSITIEGQQWVDVIDPIQLRAVVTPESAIDKSVTWKCTAGWNFIDLSEDGVVTFESEGVAHIVAEANDGSGVVSQEFIVQAVRPQVREIQISGEKTVKNKRSTKLTAKCLPDEAVADTVTWSITSGSEYADIDAEGNVTGKAAGNIVVTATAKDFSKTKASFEMTVEHLTVESVEITNKINDYIIGDQPQLIAKVLPEDAEDTSVTWTSSMPGVVDVEDGRLIAHSTGESLITVTAKFTGGKTVQDSFTVHIWAEKDCTGYITPEDGIRVPFFSFEDSKLCDAEGQADIVIAEKTYDRFKFNYPITICSKAAESGIPSNFLLMKTDLEDPEIPEFNSTVTLPTGLSKIEDNFMAGCLSFNQPLQLPDTITSIGDYFLLGCESYTQQINLPDLLNTIGDGFMTACGSFNSPITFPNGLKTIGDYFLTSCMSFNSEIIFNDTLETIGNEFMMLCRSFNQNLSFAPAQGTLAKIGHGFLYGAWSMCSTINLGNATPEWTADIIDEEESLVTLGDMNENHEEYFHDLSIEGVTIAGTMEARLRFASYFGLGGHEVVIDIGFGDFGVERNIIYQE